MLSFWLKQTPLASFEEISKRWPGDATSEATCGSVERGKRYGLRCGGKMSSDRMARHIGCGKARSLERISTGDHNPDLQRQELPEYCQRRGWHLVETYEDHISGGKDRRPSLDRLMADARRRKFDVVVVWHFDRFARSTSHLLRALEEFYSLGIDFVPMTESIDTSTPAGKMVFTVLAAIAELERSIIKERAIAGQRAAKRRGVRFGRPNVSVPIAQVEATSEGLELARN
jgi:DNA invertase Pin-like site-specific DNA recombinase